jgi:CheY-like chemotaxis protein
MTVNGVSLAGRRVLIVEDNFILAAGMARILKAQGAEIIGPAGTVTDALALIAVNERIDGAALDVNLNDEMVYPVADALRTKNMPMVFMTGCDERGLHVVVQHTPWPRSPCAPSRGWSATARQRPSASTPKTTPTTLGRRAAPWS